MYSPQPKYYNLPDTELVAQYRKGGYHPIIIDDILNKRYCIVNKLGYGSYGTVWLVEDLSLRRFASLKVVTADASDTSFEIDVLRHLRTQQQQTPAAAGAEYVMKVFDVFEIVGPNGTHQCVVTELLGPHLGCDIEAVYANDRFPVDVKKRLAAQIARGVAYLHKCGVVHGDLHIGNMLLYTPEIERFSHQEIQRYYEKPGTYRTTRQDRLPVAPNAHLPQYMVPSSNPTPLLQLCLALPERVHVKICDFGEAFLYDVEGRFQFNPNTPIRRNVPLVYAAPEILFDEPTHPEPATDIWALAVLLHMILSTNNPLFSPYNDVKKQLLCEMVLTLGKLPQRWWTRWAERGEYFNEDGEFVGDSNAVSGWLVKLAGFGMTNDDIASFEWLVRRMVCYEMKDRITANEVVRCIPAAWMRGG